MKRLARIPGLKIWTLLLLAAGTFSSCNVLTEEEQDCTVYVRFKYDMNMKFADAFQNAVNSVTLYAFDKNGVLAYQKTEEGDLLKQDGYRMRLDGISHSDKAEYDFITWAGEPDNESFTIPVLIEGKHTKEDLYCQLNRAGDGIVNDNLEDLFHGQVSDLNFGRAAMQPGEEVVMPLVKNTNSIRIMLQHISGEPLNVDEFKFSITDYNGKMNYDNTLLDKDVKISYQAWYTGNGNADVEGENSGTPAINVAIAELAVSRLMADAKPVLTVTDLEGKEILKLDLVQCALMYKREKYNDMSNQEFLDREDEYNFTFFLDDGNRWISSSIIINSWRVVLQNSDLQ